MLRRFLESGYLTALLLSILATIVQGIVLFVATSGPVHAQGTGVGTLPIIRQAPALTQGQIAIVSGSPTDLAIGSTADTPAVILAEYEHYRSNAPAGEHDAQVVSSSWVSHGHTVEVHTSRWANEAGPDGARHWAKRHEEAVEAMEQAFPPDPKTGGAGS